MLDRTRRPRQIGALLFSLACLLAVAPGAMAADGDMFLDQCFTGSAFSGCTTISPNFTGMDVEISKDGKQAYAAVNSPASVRIFDRGANNRLTYRSQCFDSAGANGCTATPGLDFSWDIEVTNDGTSVYVATGAGIASFQRNPSTGNLTPGPCYGTAAGCTPIAPVGPVYTLQPSPDGNNVYTRGNGTFGVFQRNPATGVLIPEPDGEDCFSETATAGCSDTYGLRANAFEMDFSPDGKFLYYPIQTPGGVGFFQRSSNGTLTQISGPQGGCITTDGSSTAAGECATIPDGTGPAMGNAWATNVSPSGKHVFVSGSSGLVVFSRDAADGRLTKTDCNGTVAGCKNIAGGWGMDMALSPDGRRLAVQGFNGGGATFYDFNEANGVMTQLGLPSGCFLGGAPSGCSNFPNGSSYGHLTWTPDGLNVYAMTQGSSLVNIVRDAAPVCQSSTVQVATGSSIQVPLSCTDANGDAVSLEITKAPGAGLVGAIDQDNDRVFYSPFGGVVGTDSFEYRGVARGAGSPAAKVTVNVTAAPVTDADKDGVSVPQDCNDNNPAIRPGAVDTPNNGVDEDCDGKDASGRVTSGVTAKWKYTKKSTRFTQLIVSDVPKGGSVIIKCAGKGCPKKSKTFPVAKGGKKSVLSFLNFKKGKRKITSKLRVKTKLTVIITAPNFIGKAVSFTIRSNKDPLLKAQCTRPGSTTVQNSC
jgi:hypothetical protein